VIMPMARLSSTRLPQKNLRPLGGKPMAEGSLMTMQAAAAAKGDYPAKASPELIHAYEQRS